jgi:hypothetical protein
MLPLGKPGLQPNMTPAWPVEPNHHTCLNPFPAIVSQGRSLQWLGFSGTLEKHMREHAMRCTCVACSYRVPAMQSMRLYHAGFHWGAACALLSHAASKADDTICNFSSGNPTCSTCNDAFVARLAGFSMDGYSWEMVRIVNRRY